VISSLTVARQRGILTRFPPRQWDEVARTKEVVKEQTDVVGKIYSLRAVKSNGARWRTGVLARPADVASTQRSRASLDLDGSETRPQIIPFPIQSFRDLQRVQIGQQILHLRLRHCLAEGRHHVAARHNHFAHALVIRRHSAL
jgi:hypothetical protein